MTLLIRKTQLLKAILILLTASCFGQNPIIRDQFTADPSARVFGNKVYVFPSHDVAGIEGKGRPQWFVMEDYHVFSSENLTEWNDHGVIVSQNKVKWVDSLSYSMWAPDCIEKNDKYYFYFPALLKDTTNGRGFGIGVAIATQPEGPYIPQPEPIKNVRGIDPNIFIDTDGQAYLYWAARDLFVAKLKDNMLELDSEPITIANLPNKGLKEGPFMFERSGKYYLTYPHVSNKTESLEYAMSDNPLGPFKITGTIMDESPTGCWTNHQSIINFKNQWYLFYHHNDYSPSFDKNRSNRIDSLFFNDDGTIRKVKPTLRGVGITKATENIQLDRYSHISEIGTEIMLHDTIDTFKGWKTIFNTKDAWIQYNSVDFGQNKLKKVTIKALATKGAKLKVKLNTLEGYAISEIIIPASDNWATTQTNLSAFEKGIQNIFLVSNSNEPIEIDWISFE